MVAHLDAIFASHSRAVRPISESGSSHDTRYCIIVLVTIWRCGQIQVSASGQNQTRGFIRCPLVVIYGMPSSLSIAVHTCDTKAKEQGTRVLLVSILGETVAIMSMWLNKVVWLARHFKQLHG